MNHFATQPAAPKFKIDKFVALPKISRSATFQKPAIYPWAHMQPGDSFFVPGGSVGKSDKRPGVKTQITAHGAKKKYPGTTWAVRAVTENGINGIRVWRVS